MKVSAISVDLDSLQHYCRIQGVPESVLDDRARSLVDAVAVPRYLELFDKAGVPATFFAIGAEAGPSLRRAREAGVEIASHSFAHDYAMSRWPADRIEQDLDAAHTAITEASGAPPVGFRAPGYTLSAALLRAVARKGYAYDSSAYPAAPYWAAKAGVMGALKVLGRPSRAILDSPRVLLAPIFPYRPALDQPYGKGDAPLKELPIAVAPVTRVPFIGTFVTMMPWPVVTMTYRAVSALPLLNFELHAVDVLDVSDGIPEELARQQRDLKVPATEKLSRLSKLFGWMKESSDCLTLRDAASRFDLN
ncbi:MAG: polysaccharide deacetylase family protein [Myxococcaceae bacterium]|nr:polysaccharide deacetylase family protein [Myxococcaceae bacterium]